MEECKLPAEVEDVAQLAVELEALLAATGDHLASLVDGSTSRGGVEERTFSGLSGLFASYHAVRRRLQDTELSVGVLALAKSGKSTLVNALCGANLMPANNVPETARITSVKHAPHLDHTTARLSYRQEGGDEEQEHVEVLGTDAIRAHLRDLNQAARERGWCGVREEELLSIEVPIAALTCVHRPGTPGVRLLDTPGPNEFGQDGLRFRVERLLEGVDAVLYLLDYTKLKTREEGDVLQRLREINPALVQRLCRRLHFVVNKCDVMESCEGLGEEETRQYVAALVTEQLGGAGAASGFVLHPDQVFLLSARDALLARLVLEGRAGPEDRKAFMVKAFGKRWARVKEEGEVREEALEMLKGSGILELEAGVMGFLASRCAVLRLVAVMDDLERLVAQMSNLAQTAAGTLRADVATLHAQVAGMQARLDRALSQFESVQQEVQALEGHVVDEVRSRLDGLRRKLEGDIDAALGVGAPGGASAPVMVAPRGRWPAIWGKAKRFLFGGSDSGATSPEEVQMRLAELHSDIYLQIEAEVKDFWHSLETATNDKQKQLFAAINAHVAALSRLIESEVCQGLGGLALAPADMRIAPPSAEQFHASLQELFAKGIRQQSRTETQVRREQRVVFVKEQGGLCNSFEYWVPRTEESVVTEEVQVVSYSPDPDKIKEYFAGVVVQTTANSARYVRHYVHRYLEAQLEAARGRLAAYAKSFSAAMADALAVARQGEEERGAALAAAEAHCREAAALLERVHALQATAEELLGPSEAEAQDALERLTASYYSLVEPPAPASTAADPTGSAAGASTVAALAELSASGMAAGGVLGVGAFRLPPLPHTPHTTHAGAGAGAGARVEGTAEAGTGAVEQQAEEAPGWAAEWGSMHSALGWTAPAPAAPAAHGVIWAAPAPAAAPAASVAGPMGHEVQEEDWVGGEVPADLSLDPLAGGPPSLHSSSLLSGEERSAHSRLPGPMESPYSGPPSLASEDPTSVFSSLACSQLSVGAVTSASVQGSSRLLAAAEAAGAYAAAQQARQAELGAAGLPGGGLPAASPFLGLAGTENVNDDDDVSEEGEETEGSVSVSQGGEEGLEAGPGSPLVEVPLVAEGEAEAGSAAARAVAAEHAGLAPLSSSASEEWTVVEEGEGEGIGEAGEGEALAAVASA